MFNMYILLDRLWEYRGYIKNIKNADWADWMNRTMLVSKEVENVGDEIAVGRCQVYLLYFFR